MAAAEDAEADADAGRTAGTDEALLTGAAEETAAARDVCAKDDDDRDEDAVDETAKAGDGDGDGDGDTQRMPLKSRCGAPMPRRALASVSVTMGGANAAGNSSWYLPR